MSDLKTCPLCGNLLEIVRKNGSKYVRCISGICIFETARHGYHISDDELINRCNRRPAEDAKDREIENLKAEVTRYRRALHNLKEDCQKRLHWKNSSWEKLFLHEVVTHIDAELDFVPDNGKMEENK